MAEATQKRARDADAIDLTEDASPEKKHKVALNAIAEEFLCPITQALPVQPVMAEDCKIYERDAILDWFAEKAGAATSPSTGAAMGTKLLPAVQARNTIESLIQSGAIEGELAEAWQEASAEKRADETLVKEWRAKAEGGDGDAMWRLGECYKFGLFGVAVDEAQACAWFERSAAARDPKGLASFGDCLLRAGVRKWVGAQFPVRSSAFQDIALGLMNMTQAAELGSDFGAYALGEAFFFGNYGLPKDPVRARFWVKKVVEGECKFKHVCAKSISNAARMLAVMDAAE